MEVLLPFWVLGWVDWSHWGEQTSEEASVLELSALVTDASLQSSTPRLDEMRGEPEISFGLVEKAEGQG